MSKIKYILLACIAMLQACKRDEVVAPAFDVTTDKKTYKIGETITFNFSGNPDVVDFFSGENGKRYQYYGRTAQAGKPVLQFTTVRNSGVQSNSLQLMVSSDFAGVGTDAATTVTNITKGTWTDISSKAAISAGPSTVSGPIDLTDIATANKPIYIAFKYSAVAGSIQNKYTITALTLTNTLADNTVYTIANLSAAAITNYGVATTFSPGWVAYPVSNTFNWVVTAGSSLVITGAATAAAATAPAEAWTFSGPIDLQKVSPDYGLVVKDILTKASTYTYKYAAAGTYNLTFVGTQANYNGRADQVKQMTIEVMP
jgi:hypothetical protein